MILLYWAIGKELCFDALRRLPFLCAHFHQQRFVHAAEVEVLTMQEQANEKTVGLVCRSVRMSASTFARLCERYLRHRRMVVHDKKISKRYDPATQRINQPKRIKVKELVKEGSGVSTVEIKRSLRRFMRSIQGCGM